VLEKRLLPHGRRAGAPLGRVAWLRAVAISFAISGVMVGGIAATSGASGVAPPTSAAADVTPTSVTTSTVPASDDVPPPGTAATTTTTTTTTTTLPPAPPPAPAPAPPPPPAAAPAPVPAPPPPPVASALPARGAATASGCTAALAYLAAYSAPGFTFECPGYALGHEAMTCINEPGACPGESLIAIADPCAHAYMNEASNSWVLTGQSSAPIDPYGAC